MMMTIRHYPRVQSASNTTSRSHSNNYMYDPAMEVCLLTEVLPETFTPSSSLLSLRHISHQTLHVLSSVMNASCQASVRYKALIHANRFTLDGCVVTPDMLSTICSNTNACKENEHRLTFSLVGAYARYKVFILPRYYPV